MEGLKVYHFLIFVPFLLQQVSFISFFINFKDSMGIATMDGLIFNFSITRITCMKFNTVE